MTNPILHALQAHTKEPEEVDWEARCNVAVEAADYWAKKFFRANGEITRLEQRCAKAEGRYPTDMVVKFSESEREKWLRGEWLGDTQDDS